MIAQIRDIAAQLRSVYPAAEAEDLAWWVAEEMTGLTRSQIITGCKITKNIPNVQEIVDRLLHFEPVQYIFGHTLWCGLDLKVTPATLIPRPETAELVDKVERLQLKAERPKILDIGTGSGCIAIALKKRHPDWEVTGMDISPEAIVVAQENARRNGVEVNFLVADILSDEIGRIINSYDVIVSNPPYVCEREKEGMRRNVLDYEPATALYVPDDDPLRFYRRIAELSRLHSSPFTLFFEINEAYPAELTAMLEGLGYTDIHVTNDIYGKPRIIDCRMVK